MPPCTHSATLFVDTQVVLVWPCMQTTAWHLALEGTLPQQQMEHQLVLGLLLVGSCLQDLCTWQVRRTIKADLHHLT